MAITFPLPVGFFQGEKNLSRDPGGLREVINDLYGLVGGGGGGETLAETMALGNRFAAGTPILAAAGEAMRFESDAAKGFEFATEGGTGTVSATGQASMAGGLAVSGAEILSSSRGSDAGG